MINFIFFFLNQLVLGDSSSKEDKTNLIIDFGGKYIKGSLINITSNKFSYLTENGNNICGSSNDCYSIPNSISASVNDLMHVNKSEDAVKIGIKAYETATRNRLLGIQYFGAIFNRKPSYIGANCDYFNLDLNVTVSNFEIFWYLIQFFSKYQQKTTADEIAIILPGYTTDKTIEEMKIANNQTFNKITVLKDYDIIQKVHVNIFNGDNSRNALYIDFGAFSTKATVVTKQGEIVSYEFNEESGIEKVAFRQLLKSQVGKEKSKHLYDDYLLNTKKEAYKEISSDAFYDEIFEKNLNDLIVHSIENSKVNTNSNFVIDEIVLIGGGCELPFVIKTVEKLSNGTKFELIEKIQNNLASINHLTFLVDGYQLPAVKESQNLFVYHPLFIEYNNQTHRIPGVSNINKKIHDDQYQFKINLGKIQRNQKPNQTSLWDGVIKIVTDSYHVIGGMSKIVLKLNISDLKSDGDYENKFIQLIGSFDEIEKCENSFGLKFEAELCDVNENKELVCSDKFNVVKSNAAIMKSLKAKKKADENDAAMALIRALFDSVSKVKNNGKKEEL